MTPHEMLDPSAGEIDRNEGQGLVSRAETASVHRWGQHLAHIAVTRPPIAPAVMRNPVPAARYWRARSHRL